jgi:UDP-N-acetyl-D-glucosamine/UDP-N-acetyl-D-galactosamine dehydrogenase
MKDIMSSKIAVIGLGYVGLPLASEFGKKYRTFGFDINEKRVLDLKNGDDETLEVSKDELSKSKNLTFHSEVSEIANADIFIVTVPTPINRHKQPDLSPLISASNLIGGIIKKGDIVIYESTVFPGATEDECIPVIELTSGLKFNVDFFAGYSPERINPGDKEHRISSIMKVTSGSTFETAEFVDRLYKSIIDAGTFKASSIKVAEAAKVIENTQRDLNIALVNELAVIFNKLSIDTEEVLEAAGTKWNFLPFRPGLVGGHCIGVDPYYLTHKSESIGYKPEVILAGRRINDGMGVYIANELIKAMIKKRIHVYDSNVLIMGLTFKENCPDIRNTKVVDVIDELKNYGINIDIYDPVAEPEQVKDQYGYELLHHLDNDKYDAVVIAVAHEEFIEMGTKKIRKLLKKDHILYDLKFILDSSSSDIRL